MSGNLDVLFVNPNASEDIYQGLSVRFSAIEPPTWSLLLAQSCRAAGFSVAILDCDAERLSDEQAVKRIAEIEPRVLCFVVYGANPNSGTTTMEGAIRLGNVIKECSDQKICFVGSHASALPYDVLRRSCVDFVLLNEGVIALQNLLRTDLEDVEKVKGIGHKAGGKTALQLNPPEKPVPQDRMDSVMPGYAWDLLPFKEKPLDLYRAHFWHAQFDHARRAPFAALYTSLGCKFKCLSGSTLVNTIFGKIPIKELVETPEKAIVYTYDQEARRVIVKNAINVRKIATLQQIVRVHFIGGGHIDVTPDHKFLKFINGNAYRPTMETVIEARDLTHGMRLRSLAERVNRGYVTVTCWRGHADFAHRLIVANQIGRPLRKKEQVHHKDHNPGNNDPSNLELMASAKEHFKQHPEIAERMRLKNPIQNMTPEWRAKLRVGNVGKKRTPEQRQRYRESKLGVKNPNYIDGHSCGQPSRTKNDINHRVDFVEWLAEPEDVYCLTVPGNGWFFANDVLVANCSFCMINIVNRDDNDSRINAANTNQMRFWSPELIVAEFDKLAAMGVRTIRISDEMFFLDKRYFEPLLNLLVQRDYASELLLWTYSRIDTVREKYLELFKKAGINWLALGIEAGNQNVRQEVTKGSFKDINIRDVVGRIGNAGISVIANYIYGLPHDTQETMQQTLDLAIELNTEMYNAYPAMALPGSPLYQKALDAGIPLPQTFSGWSFLSYDCLPLSTDALSAAQVLQFRDDSVAKYFNRPEYLNMIEAKFGVTQKNNILQMLDVKLKRKLLGH